MRLSKQHLPYLALLSAFLVVFFWFLNAGFLGHDYFYFFPKLLDGKWHFARQGLRMFWYTAHFCGGFPEFANPQSMYYSLPQILVFFFDMWSAVQLTLLISMLIGYAGWYCVGRDLIRLHIHWAHVLALIISAHGFHFMHMVPGHVPFHSMPLIGWLLWLILDRKNRSIHGLLIKAAWFALATAYILYSGGYMVFVMLLFALLTLVPFELLLSTTPRQRLATLCKNSMTCAVGAIGISASKLVATLSFFAIFPERSAVRKAVRGYQYIDICLSCAICYSAEQQTLYRVWHARNQCSA